MRLNINNKTKHFDVVKVKDLPKLMAELIAFSKDAEHKPTK